MTNANPAAGFQAEIQFEVLRRLDRTPDLSQRRLARDLGISLGSINYCLRALMQKGWIKMQNFSQSRRKLAYAYLLTPAGMAEKARLTAHFLQRKQDEYAALHAEIRALEAELASQCGAPAEAADARPPEFRS
jgi:EPS-associated MarR family transcriptional regulator